jgi:hypothetical protein
MLIGRLTIVEEDLDHDDVFDIVVDGIDNVEKNDFN